ncbi:Inner membrane protein YphA [Variovorax sp. PBL-H6]|uniref:DoxX family protein n=1 Tax=Variovorax sp. PBL-H6 TaxID=434009 RepID=UPI0013175F5C|nr:DoxX family protein [Variovorax sp. PBL-H6]VTU29047.1 Inner membrane protein YphA [Variovorax sp. PBL-H6]
MSSSTTTASTFAVPATASTAQDTLALIGRVLIALLFVPAGFGKLTGFAGVVGYIGSVGLPVPQLGAAIAIVAELGVGLMFLVGYKTRIAAIVLAVFTIAASIFFHNYWALSADKAMVNQLMFFKNIAVAGGLLAFAAFGAGRFSLDKR